jgi:hypothetical protein
LILSQGNRKLLAMAFPPYNPKESLDYWVERNQRIRNAVIEAGKIQRSGFKAAGYGEIMARFGLTMEAQRNLDKLLQSTKLKSIHNRDLYRDVMKGVDPKTLRGTPINSELYSRLLTEGGASERRNNLVRAGWPQEIVTDMMAPSYPTAEERRKLREGFEAYRLANEEISASPEIRRAFNSASLRVKRALEAEGGRMEIIRL